MSAPLDSRVIRILRCLLNKDGPVSTAIIAGELGLSPRVVRYRLPTVENYLSKVGVSLERQPGLGIWLSGDELALGLVAADLDDQTGVIQSASPKDRIRIILALLLWSAPTIVSLDWIAKELHISKGSARRDLRSCEEWLEKRGLSVLRRSGRGVSVVGSERRLRQVMVQLFVESIPQEVLAGIQDDNPEADYLVQVRVPAGIRGLISGLPIAACRDLVSAIKLNIRGMSENSETVLGLYLAVISARIGLGHGIELDVGQQRSLIDHPVSDAARSICEGLSDSIGIDIGEEEIAGVTEYLLGIDALGLVDQRLDLFFDKTILESLLEIAAERLHPSLLDDAELRLGLSNHLGRLEVRLKYGLPVHNPLLAEVVERYPKIHEVAMAMGSLLSTHMGLSIVEDEMGFMTMYLLGALERARQVPRKKALVVCPSGMATVWVLVARLQVEFPELELVQVLSLEDLRAETTDKEFDLIISTVAIDGQDSPTFVVSPLLTATNVKQLARFI